MADYKVNEYQTTVEYDDSDFKYGLSSYDNALFDYEDPLFPIFDIILDGNNSPLLRTTTDQNNLFSFLNDYNSIEAIRSRIDIYKQFKNILYNLFNLEFKEIKRNKSYYINSIAGLDKLTARMTDFEKDKITITLNEDVSMIGAYLIHLYNNLTYSYKDQRNMIPANLLRFNMYIKIHDVRNMPRYIQNASGSGTTTSFDKSYQIYLLRDCTFDFKKSKNFDDSITVGGFDAGAPTKTTPISFDVVYKSIEIESEYPLIDGSLKLNNKNQNLLSDINLNSIYTNNTKSVDEIESELTFASRMYKENKDTPRFFDTDFDYAGDWDEILDQKLIDKRFAEINNNYMIWTDDITSTLLSNPDVKRKLELGILALDNFLFNTLPNGIIDLFMGGYHGLREGEYVYEPLPTYDTRGPRGQNPNGDTSITPLVVYDLPNRLDDPNWRSPDNDIVDTTGDLSLKDKPKFNETIDTSFIPKPEFNETIDTSFIPKQEFNETIDTSFIKKPEFNETIDTSFIIKEPLSGSIELSILPQEPLSGSIELSILPQEPLSGSIELAILPQVPLSGVIDTATIPQEPLNAIIDTSFIPRPNLSGSIDSTIIPRDPLSGSIDTTTIPREVDLGILYTALPSNNRIPITYLYSQNDSFKKLETYYIYNSDNQINNTPNKLTIDQTISEIKPFDVKYTYDNNIDILKTLNNMTLYNNEIQKNNNIIALNVIENIPKKLDLTPINLYENISENKKIEKITLYQNENSNNTLSKDYVYTNQETSNKTLENQSVINGDIIPIIFNVVNIISDISPRGEVNLGSLYEPTVVEKLLDPIKLFEPESRMTLKSLGILYDNEAYSGNILKTNKIVNPVIERQEMDVVYLDNNIINNGPIKEQYIVNNEDIQIEEPLNSRERISSPEVKKNDLNNERLR